MKAIKNLNRNVVYLAIVIIVLAVMFITEPHTAIAPHGIFLPSTNKSYPAVSASNVQVYKSAQPGAKIIGQIRVERHFDKLGNNTEAQVVNYARNLAAKSGATGLVVKTFFGTPQPGLDQRYIFIADAIVN